MSLRSILFTSPPGPRLALLAAALLTGCDPVSNEQTGTSGSAAQPAETSLGADSSARFPIPFTTVAGLREMSDGRLLVSDRSEKGLFLVDFATGGRVLVGGIGGGPEEYAIPGRLFALPGDSTLLVDEGLQRLALVHPEGRISSTVRAPNGVLVSRLGGVGPAGDLYFEAARPGAAGPGDIAVRDSAAVVRWKPGDVRVDTVLKILVPPLVSVSLGDPAAGSVSRIAFPKPFAPGDAWGVTPTGELVRVRAEPFRVERLRPGAAQPTVGANIARPAVAVTTQDREAFPFGRQAAKVIEWPTSKPPFRYGALHVAPSGGAWVELSTPASDPAALYGVFGPDSDQLRLIRLSEGRRLVGLGQGTLYAVWKDADDLEWVERYEV